MKQPILGIEEVSLSGNEGNWIYHCNLCSVACGSVDIRRHLIGKRHRTSYALYHKQEKPNREKQYMPYGHKNRDEVQHITPPWLREERNTERNFRENDQPFPNERTDDWKQAHWNDCCNSFLKITMDQQSSRPRHDFDHPRGRSRERSFHSHYIEQMESNVHKPQLPHDPQFEFQGPSQFQQTEYMSQPHFLPSQHPPNPPHFQEHHPRFQGPEDPSSFQLPRQIPHFQEPGPPSHFPVPSHLHEPEPSVPRQFHQPEFQVEPKFQKPVFQHEHHELAYPEEVKEQKSQSFIPKNDKAAPFKPNKEKPMVVDVPTTKSSEAAVDIINLMIQDYLKNQLQKLPSQLQKILCESTRTEGSKNSEQSVSDAEIAKGKNSSNSKLPMEKNPSEIRDSVIGTSQDSQKDIARKTMKRVNPEDVASSFDQHSYKNIENMQIMQAIPFLDVASSSPDLPNSENKINKSSNDNSGELSNDQKNKRDDSETNATNNCFEQFIKSWIEHTGAVPIRSSQTEPKESTTERKNTGETSNQPSHDFSNIDHAELGRQVAAFLSKHSANLSESIGNILMGKNPQSYASAMNSEINFSAEITSNTAEATQYSRGHGLDDINRHVNPFVDQNRGHSTHGVNRDANPVGEHSNIRDEMYKRAPDNWGGAPGNRGVNPSNQSASYWVASGRDGLPSRIYFDDAVDSSHDRNRSEMARSNIDSVANTFQERRKNPNGIRERQQRDFNRRGRGTHPFRSAHSLSFLDLLNQHRNDPVFNPGMRRPGVPRWNYY